jgi:hypothetical protein
MSRWVYLAEEKTEHGYGRRLWYARLKADSAHVEIVAAVSDTGAAMFRKFAGAGHHVGNVEAAVRCKMRHILNDESDKIAHVPSLADHVEDLGSLLATARQEFGRDWRRTA